MDDIDLGVLVIFGVLGGLAWNRKWGWFWFCMYILTKLHVQYLTQHCG